MSLWLAIVLILLAFNSGFVVGAWFVTRPKLPEENDDANLGI